MVVDVFELTKEQFSKLLISELRDVIEERDVAGAETLQSKKDLQTLIITDLGLHEHWAAKREEAKLARDLEEREKDRRLQVELAEAGAKSFDMGRARSFMPKFHEAEVDVFFELFEKIAADLKWPVDKWALLVHSVLEGKAQRAAAAIDVSLELGYGDMKIAILEAYGSTPETYRRQFMELKRQRGESYLDVWRKLDIALERWLRVWEAGNYGALRELILLEQFKNMVPKELDLFE